MVVGCLSVIPLLSSASFYPLTYYAKDFVDRKDICYDFVVNHEYAEYAIAELSTWDLSTPTVYSKW